MIIMEKDYLASELNRTKPPKLNWKLSMQINNAVDVHSQKQKTFHRQDAVQDTATSESATETYTIQWSSNHKGVQDSAAQDILEVFFVLGERRVLPISGVPLETGPYTSYQKHPVSTATGPKALSTCQKQRNSGEHLTAMAVKTARSYCTHSLGFTQIKAVLPWYFPS